MPSVRVQCEFCGKTFSKKANLNRHLNSNSCTARPNPDTVRPRCRHCNGQFKSQRVLNQHLSRNQCAVQRSQPREPQEQNASPQQQLPQAPLTQSPQQVNPQQPHPQLPPELSSMTQQQQIGWLTNFLAMNDARVVQNLMQSVMAMAGTMILRLPARSGSVIEESASGAAASQQQTTSKRSA